MNLSFKLAAAVFTVLMLCGCASSATSVKKTVELKDYEKMERLLSEGRSPNDPWVGGWLTAYGQAIANGDLKAIDMFISHGYKLLPGAVFLAVSSQQERIIPDLLARGADINGAGVSDSWDLTLPPVVPALGVAILSDNIAVAEILLTNGAKRHFRVSGGPVGYFSALHIAIQKGKTDMVGVLLSEGQEQSDYLASSGINLLLDNMTPMAVAAKNGNFEIVRLLATHGAFIAYDGNYPQPIDLALASGHDEIAQWLEINGARPRPGFDYKKFLIDAGQAAATVAVIAVGIAIAVEAAKYDSDDDLTPLISRSVSTSSSSTPLAPSTTSSHSTLRTTAVAEKDGCTSDSSCGVGYRCVKGYLHNSGTCMKSADASGGPTVTLPRIDSFGANVDPQCNTTSDCPIGFTCDLKLQACIK